MTSNPAQNKSSQAPKLASHSTQFDADVAVDGCLCGRVGGAVLRFSGAGTTSGVESIVDRQVRGCGRRCWACRAPRIHHVHLHVTVARCLCGLAGLDHLEAIRSSDFVTLEGELNDAIRVALGRFAEMPEGVDRFREALFDHHASAARLRFGLDEAHLPFAAEQVPWYSLGFRPISNEYRPSRTLNYARGEFFLQDAGSMLALAACDADTEKPGRIVCDLCAAPGGKASALLESIGDGFLLANEPIRSRVAPLSYNLARTGSDRYAITSLDPDRLADRLPGVFHLVLVDAPCSGQALLGRGKQSLAALSMKQIEHSALRARRILASALRLLRPGGRLVLSTCTFAEQENESQVEWMTEQPDVTPAPCERLAAYSSGSQACYRLLPHLHGCAGSFAGAIRSEQVPSEQVRQPKRKKPSKLPREIASLFDHCPPRIRESGAVVWGWAEDAPDWVESIADGGPELAYRTGNTWKPSHAVALRTQAVAKQSVDLDEETARQFLSGQQIPCEVDAGWTVVKSDGRPLGWVKCSRGVGKNHLPGHARW